MQILVSGSTGFIGSALVPYLTVQGHSVVRLIRAKSNVQGVLWNPDAGEIDSSRLDGVDAVVHLAGENIASGRWTAAKRARLLNRRTKSTTLLAETVANLKNRPRVCVSASAGGDWGDRGGVLLP